MDTLRLGVRGHDMPKAPFDELVKSISDAGFCCTQLALAKAIRDFDISSGAMTSGMADYMKKVFEEYGISTAKHVVMAELDEDAIADMPYPLIVKPVDCNSSKGVKKVENIEELRAAFAGYCFCLHYTIQPPGCASGCSGCLRGKQYRQLKGGN